MNTASTNPPSEPQPRVWQHLERNPKSAYKSLFIKGTRIRARAVYGCFMSEEMPMKVEEIAADYGLPIEVVEEAIAYCQTNPPEILQDWRREEALMEATGMNDPNYDGHPKLLDPAERARIMRQ